MWNSGSSSLFGTSDAPSFPGASQNVGDGRPPLARDGVGLEFYGMAGTALESPFAEHPPDSDTASFCTSSKPGVGTVISGAGNTDSSVGDQQGSRLFLSDGSFGHESGETRRSESVSWNFLLQTAMQQGGGGSKGDMGVTLTPGGKGSLFKLPSAMPKGGGASNNPSSAGNRVASPDQNQGLVSRASNALSGVKSALQSSFQPLKVTSGTQRSTLNAAAASFTSEGALRRGSESSARGTTVGTSLHTVSQLSRLNKIPTGAVQGGAGGRLGNSGGLAGKGASRNLASLSGAPPFRPLRPLGRGDMSFTGDSAGTPLSTHGNQNSRGHIGETQQKISTQTRKSELALFGADIDIGINILKDHPPSKNNNGPFVPPVLPIQNLLPPGLHHAFPFDPQGNKEQLYACLINNIDASETNSNKDEQQEQ